VINELNFTEMTDKVAALYVEREECTERLATIFLQIIYVGKQNAVCARTGGLQDFVIQLKTQTNNRRYIFRKPGIRIHYALWIGQNMRVVGINILAIFKHVEQSIRDKYTLGKTS